MDLQLYHYSTKPYFDLIVLLELLAANGKSIGEVREFEGLKVQEFRNVADAFSMK